MDETLSHSYAIRPAGRADLATVASLARVIWRLHYPGILSGEQIEYMLARMYTEATLARFVDEPGSGLALLDVASEPVGFAAWYVPDEPATLKLDKLYVHPDRHRRGFGRALLDHVLAAAAARGVRTLVLNVNRGNTAAIGFYERCGFRVQATGDFAIGDGFLMEDFVMARPV